MYIVSEISYFSIENRPPVEQNQSPLRGLFKATSNWG